MRSTLAIALSLVAASALSGCADSSFKLASDAEDGGDLGNGTTADSRQALRLDVYPSSWSHPGLLPQTYTFDGNDWTELDMVILESITVSGELTGFEATSAADVSAPGADRTIAGRFIARRPGTIVEHQADTTDGSLSAIVLPDGGYDLAWIPADGLLLPFAVLRDESLRDGPDISQVLDYGVPIHGTVRASSGAPVVGVEVYVRHSETGFSGKPVVTDETGFYHLQVYPGEYELITSGDVVRYYLPTLNLPIEVGEDGLRQDLTYNHVDEQAITGQVFDADGDALEDVLVRITATDLDEVTGAELQVETETDSNGTFTVWVVEGEYTLEYIPERDGDLGPTSTDLIVSDQSADIQTVELPERPVINGIVYTPEGDRVAGATVQAKELGYDGFSFSTATDERGEFSLAVSDTDLSWIILPPASANLAVTLIEASADELGGEAKFTLAQGERIRGCVSFDGAGVSATVDVRDGSGQSYTTVLTNQDGCFTVWLDTEEWMTEPEDTGTLPNDDTGEPQDTGTEPTDTGETTTDSGSDGDDTNVDTGTTSSDDTSSDDTGVPKDTGAPDDTDVMDTATK